MIELIGTGERVMTELIGTGERVMTELIGTGERVMMELIGSGELAGAVAAPATSAGERLRWETSQ